MPAAARPGCTTARSRPWTPRSAASTWLEANELDRKTILILVGDHGEGLGEHGESTHGTISTTMWCTCLCSWYPVRALRTGACRRRCAPSTCSHGRRDGRDRGREKPARPLPAAAFSPDGETGEAGRQRIPRPSLQFGWSPLYSLRSIPSSISTPRGPELFDLAEGPRARTAISASGSLAKKAREYKKILEKLIADTGRDAPKTEAANLDQETMRRLATLGYVGFRSTRQILDADKAGLADPKDKIGVFMAVTRAGELILEEKYTEAVIPLEAALREEPAIPQALLLLSTCYVELGRTEEAKAPLDVLLKNDPESVQGLNRRANIFLDEGKPTMRPPLLTHASGSTTSHRGRTRRSGEIRSRHGPIFRPSVPLEGSRESSRRSSEPGSGGRCCRLGASSTDLVEAGAEDDPARVLYFFWSISDPGLLEEQGASRGSPRGRRGGSGGLSQGHKARARPRKLLFRMGDKLGISVGDEGRLSRLFSKWPRGTFHAPGRGRSTLAAPLEEVEAEVEVALPLAEAARTQGLGCS